MQRSQYPAQPRCPLSPLHPRTSFLPFVSSSSSSSSVVFVFVSDQGGLVLKSRWQALRRRSPQQQEEDGGSCGGGGEAAGRAMDTISAEFEQWIEEHPAAGTALVLDEVRSRSSLQTLGCQSQRKQRERGREGGSQATGGVAGVGMCRVALRGVAMAARGRPRGLRQPPTALVGAAPKLLILPCGCPHPWPAPLPAASEHFLSLFYLFFRAPSSSFSSFLLFSLFSFFFFLFLLADRYTRGLIFSFFFLFPPSFYFLLRACRACSCARRW